MQKPTFIDLFAGAGGFGLGFQFAGYKPILSIEIDKWAYQTLSVNNKHKIINDDITNYDSIDKIKSTCIESPDIIIGGPPCQGFSVAASNRTKNREHKNHLFKYFMLWVQALRPKIFVIENVPGILTWKNKDGDKVIDEIRKISQETGYNINIWRLNAANYGVPQSRERIFIIGTIKEIETIKPIPTNILKNQKKSLFPQFLPPAITVGEAILDLPPIKAKEGEEIMDYETLNDLTKFQLWARNGSRKIYNHVAMKHTERLVKRYQNIIDGNDTMPEELKVRKRNGGGVISEVKFNQNYRHLLRSAVSYTIPASFYSSFIHPTIPRNITAREAARIQSFPDWYVFKGKRTIMSNSLLKKLGKEDEINLSQYNQVGNAVPPLLAKAIANQLKTFLD